MDKLVGFFTGVAFKVLYLGWLIYSLWRLLQARNG